MPLEPGKDMGSSLCSGLYSKQFLCNHPFHLQESCEAGPVIAPVLRTKTLRHREVKSLAQGHTALPWYSGIQEGFPQQNKLVIAGKRSPRLREALAHENSGSLARHHQMLFHLRTRRGSLSPTSPPLGSAAGGWTVSCQRMKASRS